MLKLTYLELLQMVAGGNIPKKIDVFGMRYTWLDDCAYVNDSTGKLLTLYLGNCSEEVLTTWNIVKVIE